MELPEMGKHKSCVFLGKSILSSLSPVGHLTLPGGTSPSSNSALIEKSSSAFRVEHLTNFSNFWRLVLARIRRYSDLVMSPDAYA